MTKVYEITVSFCVYAENQESAFEQADGLTQKLQRTLECRGLFQDKPEDKNMTFFHIDEPQEVKV